jgi:NAD(P)-dependent dehydrogenase (short-subunit alcohol dehydrogenase family)
MARMTERGELDFSGRTALVTGAGRNIGRAIVLEFARRGATVVVHTGSDRAQADAVAKEARELGADALVVVADLTEDGAVDTVAAQALERFGRVDISVSNAARRLYKSFDETTDADWHLHLNMQLTASWYLAKAFVPGMRDAGWGRIIHIGGPDGWDGGPRRLPHSAAKGALHTFTKGLAYEVGPWGITVNEVVPGAVATERDPVTHPQVTDESMARVAARNPIRRLVTVEDIAWACLWLAADRSDAITGTSIHVDGGGYRLA